MCDLFQLSGGMPGRGPDLLWALALAAPTNQLVEGFGDLTAGPGSGNIAARLEPVKSSAVESNPKTGLTRRGVLSLFTFMALTSMSKVAKAQQLHVDGGLADLTYKESPKRRTPLVPPGAVSVRNLTQHCTACLLCVSACPNNVLRPSNRLAGLLQPEMSYEAGYCRPECTECSQVCPAGAIQKIPTAEKSGLSLGRAIWSKDSCLAGQGQVQCTSCQNHCPTGAITLISQVRSGDQSLKIPAIDQELCLGCGACEYYCPARPFSAIYVEGHARHHKV